MNDIYYNNYMRMPYRYNHSMYNQNSLMNDTISMYGGSYDKKKEIAPKKDIHIDKMPIVQSTSFYEKEPFIHMQQSDSSYMILFIIIIFLVVLNVFSFVNIIQLKSIIDALYTK